MLETDRGVSLTRDEHKEVAELVEALKEFCVDEPVKCPLIFGGKVLFWGLSAPQGICFALLH